MASHNPPKGTIPLPVGVAEARVERFDRLAEAIAEYNCSECSGHDQSVPGADRHGRYAVHGQKAGGRSELTRCSSPSRAEVVADSYLGQGWSVVALYDLDTLAGDEPRIAEGDVADLDGQRHVVIRVDEDLVEGELALYAVLVAEDNMRPDLDWDDWDQREPESELTIIERAEPDERLPVKYDVAAIVQRVVFNTVPSS